MDKRFVYMDYNATTPLRDEVKASMIEDLGVFANASSMHEAGRLELPEYALEVLGRYAFGPGDLGARSRGLIHPSQMHKGAYAVLSLRRY